MTRRGLRRLSVPEGSRQPPGADSRFPREFDTDHIFWKINWQITPNILNVLNDTAEVGLVCRNLLSPNLGKGQVFVDPLRAMIGVKFAF